MTALLFPTLLLAGGVAAVTGCSTRAPARSQGEGARQAIQAAVERYVEASNRGDVDGLTALYAENAVLLPPDHEPVEGRDAIAEFWRQGTDSGLAMTTIRLDVDGDVGYLVGRYRLPATDEEPADSGKTVMCLRRQEDGSWKLTADIWNSSAGDDSTEADDDTSPTPSIT